MPKTPDDIKKGLECCITDNCKGCPYYPLYEVFGCKLARAKDAITLIQHKEQENAQQAETIERLNDGCHKLIVKIQQLEAERDAAVKELKAATTESATCYGCKWYNGRNCTNELNNLTCSSRNNHWEWRGVQKEE